jgi:UDP-N-acetylglucosamine--dolichyl-phosphate N-acetylglucosaminephosphotransferase
MNYILFLCFIVSFLATFLIIPYWIKRAKKAELIGRDVHKKGNGKVAELGGICVITGFVFGLLLYIAIQTFYFKNISKSLAIMGVLSSVLIITVIGLIDDILGWKIGLRQYQKPILTVAASLPIVVLGLGHTVVGIPFFGFMDLGFFYIFLLIPVAIVGASNGFNMIAGYNGLEAGMGIIILSSMGFIAWLRGISWISMLAFIMVFALLAFWFYNKNPAKIFPGDTLTYSVGALIGIIAVLGDMSKIGLVLFIPYLIELPLKLRGKLQKESFGKLLKDGSLDVPYKKFYGLEHIIIRILKKIKGKVYENNVVYSLYLFELILVMFVFIFMV